MRLRIFKSYSKNGNPYWNFTTKAYQHEEAKLMWYVKFSKNCVEPLTLKGIANNREYEYCDVDVSQVFLGNTTEFNGKINPVLTINSYNEVKEEKTTEQKVEEFKKDNQINIESDNLPPFY